MTSNVPTPEPLGDERDDGNPLTDHAVRALGHFGGELTRAQAASLLSMWKHRGELSRREVTAVLAEFPDDGPTDDDVRRLAQGRPGVQVYPAGPGAWFVRGEPL